MRNKNKEIIYKMLFSVGIFYAIVSLLCSAFFIILGFTPADALDFAIVHLIVYVGIVFLMAEGTFTLIYVVAAIIATSLFWILYFRREKK